MYDKTATQTSIDVGILEAERPKVVGVVIVFSEEPAPPATAAVDRPLRVGRDAAMDFVVLDPKVSRQHALFEPAPGGVLITDLGSHNGTHADGVRVTEARTFARVGSTLRLGKSLVRVVADAEAFQGFPPAIEEPLVGGPALADLRRRIKALGRSASPVLVQGETGTGKERVAEAVHLASGRPGKFVPVNCAAIPSELVESELFGHAKGAFSGSQKARSGLFRTAEAGTLLLDELGELPLSLQAKLLRVVEDGMVRPVGEDLPQLVDVRIVAATNRHLEEMVERGLFRADLLHRLASMRLFLPPLRERLEDVPMLARYFLRSDSLGFSASAMQQMLHWYWPGNVRELRNFTLAAANTALAREATLIDIEDLPPLAPPPGSSTVYAEPNANAASLRAANTWSAPARPAPVVLGSAPAAVAASVGGPRPGDDVLRARIVTALELRAGNVAQVARDLGMRRPGLYEAFLRLGIDPTAYRRR